MEQWSTLGNIISGLLNADVKTGEIHYSNEMRAFVVLNEIQMSQPSPKSISPCRWSIYTTCDDTICHDVIDSGIDHILLYCKKLHLHLHESVCYWSSFQGGEEGSSPPEIHLMNLVTTWLWSLVPSVHPSETQHRDIKSAVIGFTSSKTFHLETALTKQF